MAKKVTGKQAWRKSYDYYKWRTTVINNYGKCNVCGSEDDLHAHHRMDASNHPDKKFDVKNGVVLCHHCHLLYHTLYKGSYRKKTTNADYKRFKALCKAMIKKGEQNGFNKAVDIYDI
jgi:5-methylcytosine-specific restriction endonuclease McrA